MDIKWHSQLGQDRFVATVLSGKRNGTYLDIGAGDPMVISNTYDLEHHFGWRGVLCDLETEQSLLAHRGGNTVIGDAVGADWRTLFDRYAVDGWVDYLSLDLEPPELTLEVLKMFPLDHCRFRVATVEHDRYRTGGHRRMTEMASILYAHGYLCIGTAGVDLDGHWCEIEDWWIHKDGGADLSAIGGGR